MPAVSIVLRARDEAERLAEVLQALSGQTLSDAEWILVDDGSTDGTVPVALAAGARVVEAGPLPFSYGRALNAGFAAARAPVGVALSAHAIPASRGWLEALLTPLAEPGVAASFGPEWPRPDADAVVRRGLRRRYAGVAAHALAPDGRLTFGNTNAAVRLDVWRGLRFDESLPYAEDLDWSLRAMAAGHRIVFTPRAAVYHSHRDSPQAAYRRAYAEGVAARRLGRPQRQHRAGGLCLALAAGSALDALTLLSARAPREEWARSLRCRWARSLGGWRGYRAGVRA